MDPETRESLIARLPNYADSAAWDEFVDLYEPLIYGIARRHGLQAVDAHDLVQDVFAAVAESIERFKPDRSRGRFRTWLFRVARNQALNKLRDVRRRGSLLAGGDQESLLASAVPQENSDAEFDAALRRRAFRWAARRVRESIKPNTWDLFARTAIEGQSPQSVADELRIEVGAVYLARSRVMAKLRRQVEDVSVETLALQEGESGQNLNSNAPSVGEGK